MNTRTTLITFAVLVVVLLVAWYGWNTTHPTTLPSTGTPTPSASTTTTIVATSTPITPGSGGTISHSGVRGSITLGPTCPMERIPPDPACADKPYQTTITARVSSTGSVFGQVQSSADGTFTLMLPPGTYVLSAGSKSLLPRCAEVSVTVPTSGYASTTISCDTGIR